MHVLIILTILFIIILSIYCIKGGLNLTTKCTVPEMKGLPFLGNIFQLDPKDMHKCLANLSERYGEVFQFRVFGERFISINSPRLAYEANVIKGNEFADRPSSFRIQAAEITHDIASRSYDDTVKFLRKVCIHSIKSFSSGMTRIEIVTLGAGDYLVKELTARNGDVFDPHNFLYRATCRNTVMLLFGYVIDHDDAIIDYIIELDQTLSQAFSSSLTGMLLDMFPWLQYLQMPPIQLCRHVKKLKEELRNKWIIPHLESWSANKERGVADALFSAIHKPDNKHLYEDHLVETIMNLITAGVSTTTLALYAFLSVICNRGDIQEKLQQEIDAQIEPNNRPSLSDKVRMPYTQAFILELLRVTSGPIAIPHQTSCHTSLQGYQIPKNTTVFFNLFAMHHHPKYWSDPFEFKPERFLDETGGIIPADHPIRKNLLPFGSGPRTCVGESFARSRLFLFITSILQKLSIEPADQDNPPICDQTKWKFGLIYSIQSFKIRTHLR